jgi:outer membrane protein, heavy metal efflux system
VRRSGLLTLLRPWSFAGCVAATPAERAARAEVRAVGAALAPAEHRPELPVLTPDATVADYLRFALLNHPQVQAAYQDWRAAVLAIAPARALPDPKLTFQADIRSMVTSVMPGFMFDIMSTGRRSAMAQEATAASEVARRRYVTAVLVTAAEVKKSWADLTALEEIIRFKNQELAVVQQALAAAQSGYATAGAMGSLGPQVDLVNELGKLKFAIANLEDERGALRDRFKASLGIDRDAPDPTWPARFTPSPAPVPDDDAFWAAARAANPRLGEMRAMVELTVAQVATAEKARTPDFAAGLMADLKMNPIMWRPVAALSLPIWRQKIADEIASAQARHDASLARLHAEELMVAADLARMTYMVREADRMVAYLDHVAIPSLEQTLATDQAAYQSGTMAFSMIPNVQKMILDMQVERLAALRDREKTLADLSLLIAGEPPAGAPLPSAGGNH